jgi:hypothetical protein
METKKIILAVFLTLLISVPLVFAAEGITKDRRKYAETYCNEQCDLDKTMCLMNCVDPIFNIGCIQNCLFANTQCKSGCKRFFISFDSLLCIPDSQ